MASVLASISSAPGPSPGCEQFIVTGCVQKGNGEFHTERREGRGGGVTLWSSMPYKGRRNISSRFMILKVE